MLYNAFPYLFHLKRNSENKPHHDMKSLAQLNSKAIELRKRMEAFKPRRAPKKALAKNQNGDAVSSSGISTTTSSFNGAANANPETVQVFEVYLRVLVLQLVCEGDPEEKKQDIVYNGLDSFSCSVW